MRVLVAHNFYRSDLPSGENRAVEADVELLGQASGVEVETHFRHSDDIPSLPVRQKLSLPLRPHWSKHESHDLHTTLRRFRPDVIHLHNPYPLIGSEIIRAARRFGIPVVQTLHNYRLLCIVGTFFREGSDCRDCAGGRVWPGVIHGCYRDSRPQSILMGSTLKLSRPLWSQVAAFLCVNKEIAEAVQASGIVGQGAEFVVRPNLVPDPGEPAPLREGFLYAGRLDPEKGIAELVEAFRFGADESSVLSIVGAGPLEREIAAAAADSERSGPKIRFLGNVDRTRVGELMDASAVVVLPSRCREGLPTVVVEALAHGRPVLATATKIVDGEVGWRCAPTVGELSDAIRAIVADRPGVEARAVAARRRFVTDFSPEQSLRILLETYTRAVVRRPPTTPPPTTMPGDVPAIPHTWEKPTPP